MPPISLPFVIVEWDDPWGDSSEVMSRIDAHEKHHPAIYRTHGYVVYEDEKGISLTNEECVDDQTFRGRTFIDRRLIRSVTPCKITIPRKPRSKPKNPRPLQRPEVGGSDVPDSAS